MEQTFNLYENNEMNIKNSWIAALFTLAVVFASDSAEAQFFQRYRFLISPAVIQYNGGTFSEFRVMSSVDIGMAMIVSREPVRLEWDGSNWARINSSGAIEGFDLEMNPVVASYYGGSQYHSLLEAKNLKSDTTYHYAIYPAFGNRRCPPVTGSFKTWRRVVTAKPLRLEMYDDGESSPGEFIMQFAIRSAEGMNKSLPAAAYENAIDFYAFDMLIASETSIASGDLMQHWISGGFDFNELTVFTGSEDEIRLDVCARENDTPDILVDRSGIAGDGAYWGTNCLGWFEYSSGKKFVYLGHVTDSSYGVNNFQREQFTEEVTIGARPFGDVDIDYDLDIKLTVHYQQ